VISILLVEDQVDPGNIESVLNEIFGSNNNYKLENARSLFSSILKINLGIATNYNYHLYMIDVRLKHKEDKELDFKSSFPSDTSRSAYENFYFKDFSNFETYNEINPDELDAFNKFLKEVGFEENNEGYYVWSYLVSLSRKKVRALIYSASTSKVSHLKWLGKSKVLHILEKSLFSQLTTTTYDNLFEDVKEFNREKFPIIIKNENYRTLFENSSLPDLEEELVDKNGHQINIIDRKVSFKITRDESNKGKFEIYFEKEKEDLSEYTDLMEILKLCSEDIIYNPCEHIDWSVITEERIEKIASTKDLVVLLDEPLGVFENECWTLRTLLPAHCYEILHYYKDNLDDQKNALRKLVKRYSWTDYAEIFSVVFNQGAVYLRTHSRDEWFKSHEAWRGPTDLIDPFHPQRPIANWESFLEVWEEQDKLLQSVLKDLRDKEFHHKRESGEPRKFDELKQHFFEKHKDGYYKYHKVTQGDKTRNDYLEYGIDDDLLETYSGNTVLRESHVKVNKVKSTEKRSNEETANLFFPGWRFLEFVDSLKLDLEKKNRGTLKQGDYKLVKVNGSKTNKKIAVFIFLAMGGRPFFGFPKNNITDEFRKDVLLNNFIRLDIVTKNEDELLQIFNINGDLPYDTCQRKLIIDEETIVDLERDYKDINYDALYVFTITTTEPKRVQ
jgi:hypothetical protein